MGCIFTRQSNTRTTATATLIQPFRILTDVKPSYDLDLQLGHTRLLATDWKKRHPYGPLAIKFNLAHFNSIRHKVGLSPLLSVDYHRVLSAAGTPALTIIVHPGRTNYISESFVINAGIPSLKYLNHDACKFPDGTVARIPSVNIVVYVWLSTTAEKPSTYQTLNFIVLNDNIFAKSFGVRVRFFGSDICDISYVYYM